MNAIFFGRTVLGIVEGQSVPDDFIPRLVELHARGKLPLEKIVRFYPLDQIDQAVRAAAALKPGQPIDVRFAAAAAP